MARTTVLTDDIDGSPHAKEREFSIGELHYSIDLTDENYIALLELLRPYRDAAKIRARRKNLAPVVRASDRAKIREWAQANGYALAERGRFPNSVVKAYYAATEPEATIHIIEQ